MIELMSIPVYYVLERWVKLVTKGGRGREESKREKKRTVEGKLKRGRGKEIGE